jgi:PleD family two-component response regulator
MKVTISVGISYKYPLDTLDMLLFRADEALYEAKGIGRNRVCFRE